jgi:hypothetical protein
MEKLVLDLVEEGASQECLINRKTITDPETSEELKEFPVGSRFGVKCWRGPRSFNLIVPKNIFKKLGAGDPRLDIFSKTLGARESAEDYVIKLPLSVAEGKAQESPEETSARIQEMIDSIEDAHEIDSVMGLN